MLFVTAFLDLCEDRPNLKTFQTCFGHFQRMAATGISLIVFISKKYREHIDALMLQNITCISIDLEELDIYKEVLSNHISMPSTRSENKDTLHFMILMNAKVEFMKRAMNICVSSHYAWIDFSIFHVIRDTEATIEYLAKLSRADFPHDGCMLVPGCWAAAGTNAGTLFDAINWRFCGGFFLASVDAILELHQLYRTHFRRLVA